MINRMYPATVAAAMALAASHEMPFLSEEKQKPDFKASKNTTKREVYANHGIEPIRYEQTRIGKNEACPCKSGKKFKRCCMNQTTRVILKKEKNGNDNTENG